jgi:exopolyphosphatase/guanosine-5'-triphosphate,3'-diphosphate pyrophosphatase
MTRIAVIDMGTNTFHLLIAEVSPAGQRILYRNHEAVRIGMAGINEGVITESGCQRAISAMKAFKKIIDEHQVDRVHAFGTSAFRNAGNGRALADVIQSLTGIPVEIISGDAEADYILAGVQCAMDLGDSISLVMDIGAGSVEFIIGDRNNVYWKQSFEIGGQRLLEEFQKHDPITADEIRALDSHFQKSLEPLLASMKTFQPEVLIGSSGTFDTLSDIFCIRQNISRTYLEPETPLSIEGFSMIYRELISKSRDERMRIPGMIEMRVDMIVVSSCLIRFILGSHPFKQIRVSSYSLKEGVLATLARAQMKR